MFLPTQVKGYSIHKEWGSAINTANHPELLDLPVPDRFVVLSWGAACPQPNLVFNSYRHDLGWLLARYDTTNLLTTVIWGRAAALNHNLLNKLKSWTPRENRIGSYEFHMVPAKHFTHLSPMSTLPGYASSRILMYRYQQSHTNKKHPYITVEDLCKHGLEDRQRDQAIRYAHFPEELLALLAMDAFNEGIPPHSILEHVLEPEKDLEENDFTLRLKTVSAIKELAFPVWLALFNR